MCATARPSERFVTRPGLSRSDAGASRDPTSTCLDFHSADRGELPGAGRARSVRVELCRRASIDASPVARLILRLRARQRYQFQGADRRCGSRSRLWRGRRAPRANRARHALHQRGIWYWPRSVRRSKSHARGECDSALVTRFDHVDSMHRRRGDARDPARAAAPFVAATAGRDRAAVDRHAFAYDHAPSTRGKRDRFGCRGCGVLVPAAARTDRLLQFRGGVFGGDCARCDQPGSGRPRSFRRRRLPGSETLCTFQRVGRRIVDLSRRVLRAAATACCGVVGGVGTEERRPADLDRKPRNAFRWEPNCSRQFF